MAYDTNRKVRGKRNPFVVIGYDSSTSGRQKIAPTGPTTFKSGDTVDVQVIVSQELSRTVTILGEQVRLPAIPTQAHVTSCSDPTHREVWTIMGYWRGI